MLIVLGPINGGFLRPEMASAAVPFTEGTGKVDSPYLIGTAELFNELRNYTSSKYYFKLTNDIDLSGYSTGTGWDPIADGSRIFYAHLDGNGHKITGLTINKPTTKFVGLFGMVGTGFSITNLTLENVSITGYESVGGLAGFVNLSGTIDNVSVSGQVTGTSTEGTASVHSGVGGLVGSINGATVTNSHSSANVSGDSYVGGLIGNMNRIILSNSSASGVVSGASGGVYTGGLVGDALYGTINNCYATGNVFGGSYTGGLVGANSTDTSASYATGDVSGSTYVGGLFGDAYRGIVSTSYATGDVSGSLDVGGLIGSMNTSAIGTSYATGDVYGDSNVGGLIGKSLNPSTLSNSYTSGAVSGTTSIGGLIGYKDNDLTILNSYASGLVNHGIGSPSVGGMLGESASYLGLDGTKKPILNSFYDMDSTGQSSSLGGTGVSTSQMKDQSTFEVDTAYAWDFTTIWAIHPQRNDGYPYLRTTQAYLDYSGNNGISSAIPPSRSYIPGEIVKVDSGSMNLNQNLIDAGYVFFGWNTASDGSGVTYRPGDSFTMTSDLTLYAYWMLPSSNATISSTIGTVSSGGTAEESVTSIPYGTTLAEFRAAITPASNATFNVYDSDGQTLAAVLATGKKVIVTAEDGITKVTYTITVKAAPGGNGSAPPITTPSDEGPSGHPSDHGSAEDPSTKPQPTIVFSDIIGHWSEKAIRQAAQSGIAAGYPDGTFKPNRTVTRAEFVVMLMNALKPKTAGAELNFTDADKIGEWAREAVAQAVQEGIIKGYGDGSFRPNVEITRAEMMAMISNVLKLPIVSGATGFADDKDIPEWVRGAIAAIKNLGIIQGTGSNRSNPNGNATRAEAVTVLINMLARHNQ